MTSFLISSLKRVNENFRRNDRESNRKQRARTFLRVLSKFFFLKNKKEKKSIYQFCCEELRVIDFIKAIIKRLFNSTKEVVIEDNSCNKNWIKIIVEDLISKLLNSSNRWSSCRHLLKDDWKEMKKIREQFRCSFLLEYLVVRRETKKSRSNSHSLLLFRYIVVNRKRQKSEENLCWLFSWSNIVMISFIKDKFLRRRHLSLRIRLWTMTCLLIKMSSWKKSLILSS